MPLLIILPSPMKRALKLPNQRKMVSVIPSLRLPILSTMISTRNQLLDRFLIYQMLRAELVD